MIAMENVSGDFVLRELDYSSFFELLSQDLPSDKAKILEALVDDKMIAKAETGNYNIKLIACAVGNVIREEYYTACQPVVLIIHIEIAVRR